MSAQENAEHVEKKRLAARAGYARSKSEREHALLRLRPGSLARIDQARAGLGMTRSAYIESLLDAALPPNSAYAAEPATPCAAAVSIGDQFEALFGGGG
jgi:hypothetical protein